VNLHTVRHAYAALARDGLVETTAPRGTVVIGTVVRGETGAATTVDSFAEGMMKEAEERFGMSPAALARLIADTASKRKRQESSDVVYVVECSETQAADLAHQIEERWRVVALPWSLERGSEPPTGPIVATYFHYNDIRRQWPKRFPRVHFASIRPDRQLKTRLRGKVKRGTPLRILLIERDAEMARNIAVDLSTAMGADQVHIEPRVLSDPAVAFKLAGGNDAIMFAPRVWGALTAAERRDPRAIEIRYVFNGEELASVAKSLGWEDRQRVPRLAV
jgi:hypothetical protein